MFLRLDMLLLALADYNLSLSTTYPSYDLDTLVREIKPMCGNWQMQSRILACESNILYERLSDESILKDLQQIVVCTL